MAREVAEGECPPEEGIPAPAPAPRVVVRPFPAAGPIFPFQDLLDLFRAIFAFIRGGSPVYIKAATRSEIQQYTLTDTTKFGKLTTIPADALEWELWNSDLGSVAGILDWAYVPEPGTTGNAKFNRLAVNDRVARNLADVDLYVRPANTSQVVVLEIIRI